MYMIQLLVPALAGSYLWPLDFAVLCHGLHGLALSITVPLLPFSCSFSLWPPLRAGSMLPLWLSFFNEDVLPPCPVARSGAFSKERTRHVVVVEVCVS